MVTVFKENLNLQLPLIFYSSIRFVFETVFISEQIAQNRFGALLEISDKFITKFNVFSYMSLQFRLKTVSKSYCIILKTVARQFCLKVKTFRDELLEMGIDLKIKQSVSSTPYKVWGNFFHKKALHGVANFLGQIFQGMFYMGTNDQIMQGSTVMVKRFQRSREICFSFH